MITRYLTKNPCYKQGRVIQVKGLMFHSVGVGQPDPLVFIRQFDNPLYDRACVHGFVGADETYITLPCLVNPGQAMRGWHGGKTASNNAYIGIEMTEPKDIRYISGATFQVLNRAKAVGHVEKATERMVDLFATLCTFHGLNPMTDIVSHREGNTLGIASAHGDPEHLWKGLNMDYSMDHFRTDVADRMKGVEDMTREEVIEIIQSQNKVFNTIQEVPEWGRLTVQKLMDKGIIEGTGKGLGLSFDFLRMLVVNDRAGLYD